jgi:hypothetical protein
LREALKNPPDADWRLRLIEHRAGEGSGFKYAPGDYGAANKMRTPVSVRRTSACAIPMKNSAGIVTAPAAQAAFSER